MLKLLNAHPRRCQNIAAWLVCAALGMTTSAAMAGPCTGQLAQFEADVQHAASNPDAGPIAPETTGARLSHQPTVASMKRAETAANAHFAALLARAHALDAAGDRKGCMLAMRDAQRNFQLR